MHRVTLLTVLFLGLGAAVAADIQPSEAKTTPDVLFATAVGFGGTPAGVEVGPNGKLYVVGSVNAPNVPVKNELFGHQGRMDGFLGILDASGQLEVLTYFGGSGEDYLTAVAVGADGKIHLTGYTKSADFPVTDESEGGTSLMDAFYSVLTLGEAGLALEYSTYIAGDGGEWGHALSVAGNKTVVSGITMLTSADSLYKADKIGSCSGTQNGFAVLFTDTAGEHTRDWAVMMGGSGRDGIQSSSISTHPDGDSRLVVAFGGYAASADIAPDLTTSSSLPRRAATAQNGMLATLDLASKRLLALSYVTGGGDYETPWVKLTPDGSLFFGAARDEGAGSEASVVGVRSPEGKLTFEVDPDPVRLARDFVHDPTTEQIYAVGWADWRTSASIPNNPAVSGDKLGGRDAYLAVHSDSTFERLSLLRIGGSGNDLAFAVATDEEGAIVVAGSSTSSDYLDTSGAFLTKLSFLEGPPKPAFTAAGVVNSASYVGERVAPNEIVTIYGTNLGPVDLTTMELTADNLYVTKSLAGTRVLFDDVPSPMVYAWENVVSAIVPASVAGMRSVNAQVERDGVLSDPVQVQVTQCVPGIFTIDSSGSGQAAVRLWPDYSINGGANPVARGGVIMVFATAGGSTNPPGLDGELLTGAAPHNLPVTATIGGVPATISYAGGAPSLVNGVLQVNITIPENAPTGDAVPIVITVGGVESQAGVTIAIQ